VLQFRTLIQRGIACACVRVCMYVRGTTTDTNTQGWPALALFLLCYASPTGQARIQSPAPLSPFSMAHCFPSNSGTFRMHSIWWALASSQNTVTDSSSVRIYSIWWALASSQNTITDSSSVRMHSICWALSSSRNTITDSSSVRKYSIWWALASSQNSKTDALSVCIARFWCHA